MTQKKKILIISISVSLVVALAVIFITLAFTIWKPKITNYLFAKHYATSV